MNIPSALTAEEKQLKVVFENIRNAKKALDVALSSVGLNAGAGKVEQRTDKMSIEDADLNTAELKKKVLTGMITVKKQNEKQTFKRARAIRKGFHQSASTQKSFDLSTELNAVSVETVRRIVVVFRQQIIFSILVNTTNHRPSHSVKMTSQKRRTNGGNNHSYHRELFDPIRHHQKKTYFTYFVIEMNSVVSARLSETAEDGELTDD
ncbi:Negative elongation factor E [Aphelenchoides besseyi]|nr:Negative elongation factor E [Aphelenchoides besseyi]